ncbi:MAG: hypothetical protein H6726_19820 [Sandaracinaceae bacterium]|nr:hypothetical protein [Myxococcales bacterium]MCB9659907.1 hypothetical protein [Sandaracinaceae bacterium]
MKFLRCWMSVVAAVSLLGCTDDIALVDALPGTWMQSDGTTIVFTALDAPIEQGDYTFQGRAVTSGGGVVEALLQLHPECGDGGTPEIGLLWAVVDTSKYGNVVFSIDPDFTSAESSPVCQNITGFAIDNPVLDSRARRFTLGTPRVEAFGIERTVLETFTAVELEIDDPNRPPPNRRNAGAGLADGARVVFYNAGRGETALQVLEPESTTVPASLVLANADDFATIEGAHPRAVWVLEDADLRDPPIMYALLSSEGITATHALETDNGDATSVVNPRNTVPNNVFTGQAIRFEEVGTCSGLGFAVCPTPNSKVVRIFSLFVQDTSSSASSPLGEQVLSYVTASSDVRTAPRDVGDEDQLWIVQEL